MMLTDVIVYKTALADALIGLGFVKNQTKTVSKAKANKVSKAKANKKVSKAKANKKVSKAKANKFSKAKGKKRKRIQLRQTKAMPSLHSHV